MNAFVTHHQCASARPRQAGRSQHSEDEPLLTQWANGEVKAIAYLWAYHWVPAVHPSALKDPVSKKDNSATARKLRTILPDAIVPLVDCTGDCGPETAQALLEAASQPVE